MRTILLRSALLGPAMLVAGAAYAQLTASNTGSAQASTSAYSTGPNIDIAPKTPDEGRASGGLSGRGGAADTNKTYGATIGSTYSATIGGSIGSSLPLSQPR